MLLSKDPEIYAIQQARNGLEAVTSIRTSRPDLVFLDVQMPEMDGFSVVKEVVRSKCPRSCSSQRMIATLFTPLK